ncbi:transposase family protein [Desulfocicer niacini]
MNTLVLGLRCSLCNAKSVIKRGVVIRDIRTVPIGSKTIWLRSHIQRVWCPFCQVTRQIKLSFADRGKRYTRVFEKYVLCFFIVKSFVSSFVCIPDHRKQFTVFRQTASLMGVS